MAYGRAHLPDHAFVAASSAAATPTNDLRAPDGTFRCSFAPPTPTAPCDAVDPTDCARTAVLLDRTGAVREYVAIGS